MSETTQRLTMLGLSAVLIGALCCAGCDKDRASILVRTDPPKALVFHNGELIGTAPVQCVVRDLDPSRTWQEHSIEARLDGYHSNAQTIRYQTGEAWLPEEMTIVLHRNPHAAPARWMPPRESRVVSASEPDPAAPPQRDTMPPAPRKTKPRPKQSDFQHDTPPSMRHRTPEPATPAATEDPHAAPTEHKPTSPGEAPEKNDDIVDPKEFTQAAPTHADVATGEPPIADTHEPASRTESPSAEQRARREAQLAAAGLDVKQSGRHPHQPRVRIDPNSSTGRARHAAGPRAMPLPPNSVAPWTDATAPSPPAHPHAPQPEPTSPWSAARDEQYRRENAYSWDADSRIWALPNLPPQPEVRVVDATPQPHRATDAPAAPWTEASSPQPPVKHKVELPNTPHPQRRLTCELRLVRLSDGFVLGQVSAIAIYDNRAQLTAALLDRLCKTAPTGATVVTVNLCNRRQSPQNKLLARQMDELLATAAMRQENIRFLRPVDLRPHVDAETDLENAKVVSQEKLAPHFGRASYAIIGGVALFEQFLEARDMDDDPYVAPQPRKR